MIAKYLRRKRIVCFIFYRIDTLTFIVDSYTFLLLYEVMPVSTEDVAKLSQL